MHSLSKALMICTLAGSAWTASAQEKSFSFDIPAQPLAAALESLRSRTGIHVFYAEDALKGKTSAALSGDLTVQQAVSSLLAGSGLTHTFTSSDTVAIKRIDTGSDAHTTMPAITVVGKTEYDANDPFNTNYQTRNATTATKTDTPVMELPMSVKVVPKSVINDQQITRLDDALKNVSGVFASPGNGGTTDSFIVRGFVDFNPYYNGVRLETGWTQGGLRDAAGLERVEVLKGPASILYGRIEPGGMVNMVPKTPLATPYYSLQQQFGSYRFYRTTIDATGPVTDDKSVQYRANLAYENKGSFRDFIEGERVYFAPTVHWDISDRTQATFYVDYLHNDTAPDVGGPPRIGNRPADLPRNRNLSEPNIRAVSDDILFGVDWSHAFNNQWTFRHRFFADFTEDNENLPGAPAGLADDNRTLHRTNFGNRDNLGSTYNTNVDLTGKFKTGMLAHTFMIGGDYFTFENTFAWPSPQAVPDIDIYNPVYSGNLGLLSRLDAVGNLGFEWFGLYLQDQIKLPDDVHLLLGMRYDNANSWQDFGAFGSGIKDTNHEDKVTPRVGLLWQPIPSLGVYGNYVQGFGAPNIGVYASGGAKIKPQTSEQWEAGFKKEWLDGKLNLTAAYFEITKQNIATPIANSLFFEAVGKARNRGYELDLTGEVLPGWKVIGVYSYIDSEIVSNGGVDEGHRLANVPAHGGSLWNTYTLQDGALKGLKFGAGVVARSQRQGSNENNFQLPGYAIFNALIGYETHIGKTKLTTQINADNLLDKAYFETGRADRNFWGTPRTFMGSVRLEY
ncbi:TonB-dependent receptor [Methylomonas sp. UP202]|uniref:TonB-dependent siderophore receptor n=1 Tax=Methylomonas sp. UP202 TaxID=3040943 RepID=UPI00247A6732|nr:TonB-dependent receptor [Methylomonas sp. UP202]WGS85486.1 TonB-dependent receptor [Methylomonas sp. UP202]